MRAFLRRHVAWLPTAIVLVVVLATGARLISLSVQHHAAVERDSAITVTGNYARKIEPQLQQLGDLVRRQAQIEARTLVDTGAFATAPSAPENVLVMTPDDRVARAREPEATTASGIASEWEAVDATRPPGREEVLGPLRLGSQWIIALRVPILTRGTTETPQTRGWAVAYTDLDHLVASSHLDRLIDRGYDFELSQVEPRSARTRVFVGNYPEALSDAIATRIRFPTGFNAAVAGSYLQVAVRPRDGWIPTSDLATKIGLLVFLAWLLGFGVHDLAHAVQRSHTTVRTARKRLHCANQKLATEIRQRLSLQETLDHSRFHDAFTGLPNRRYFMDQLDQALREVRTKRRARVAIILVDITRFKLVNDMLGHTAGDELMVQAARRFEKATSAFEGVLARWGGDQFAILLLNVASNEAAANVGALLQDELRAPFELRRHRLVVTASVGLTSADSGQRRAEDVVREADIALSMAKRPEGSRIVVYQPSMAGQAANLVSLEADLHVALEKHELRLLFQPVVDLRTYKMVGAEALLRWRHPVESLLAPDKFLRIAEEAGLIVPITRWIILRVCKLAAEWRRRLPADLSFFVSINLSAAVLRDRGFSQYVAAALREAQLAPSVLKFELTEAALINDVAAARETLDRLHGMGVQLMLDDFGTGYSSLSYLQLFPFSFVKIDRPFINRTGADQPNTGMMQALVQMAASLNLTAIAEIVETEAAAAALREMGCEYGQGYYFSEPIEAEQALQRLRSQQPFDVVKDVTAGTLAAPAAASGARQSDSPGSKQSGSPSFKQPGSPGSKQPGPTPAEAASPTVAIRPLTEEDDSPTLMMPAGLIEDPNEDE